MIKNRLLNFSLLITLVTLFLIAFSLFSHNQKIINKLQKPTIAGFKKEISYIVDHNNSYSIDWALQNISAFKHQANNQIPFTLSNDSYWIKLTVSNISNQKKKITLFTDNFILNKFIVYQVNDNPELNPQKIYQLSKSTFLLSLYPSVALTLKPNQQTTYLLNVKSDAAPNIPILLADDDSFGSLSILTVVISTVFVAVVLLMSLYNLVIYFAVKDKVYLFYIGYLISTLIVLASINGFGRYIFPYDILLWLNTTTLVFHYCVILFLMFFTLYFLQYNDRQHWLFTASIALCGLTVVIGLISLFFDHVVQAKIFFSIQPLFYVFCLMLVIKRLRGDFYWARYYILSWIPLLIGAVVQPLSLLNIIPNSFNTRNAFLFGVIFELILMAFALAERMRRSEQERIKTIRYHSANGLPRRSNLETTISDLISNGHTDISVVVVKPEHIERITLYINDKLNIELFQYLYKKLSSLYVHNDAIMTITDNDEKICMLNNHTLAFIIDHQKSQQPFEHLIKSTQEMIADNYRINNLQLPLSAIIGIAHYPEQGKFPHQLINNAQITLKTAENKPEKWSFFHNESAQKESNLMKMAVELKQSIDNNDLELYHQPQIDLKTLRVCSSECLLRWKNNGEFIPPTLFIPLAEDIGLIHSITLWVIKTALKQQKYLMDEYGYNHMVSVNISGKDIVREHFFIDVITIIEASGIPADKIIFELTESASFSSDKQTIALLEKLKDIGITISIDDFGTGYSTMSQINTLPFQELKVDRQFVENIGADIKRKVITKSTVEMAKGLGLEVVAEGINSQEDEDLLRQFGCDIGQGYFYAKPMAFDQYIDWLNRLNNGRIRGSLEGEFIPAPKDVN
ncbi:EAL domain-containing protein [Thalassotalea piscium]